MKKLGFTLIEILVVVLIIGILGAIMLPQYQRAVLKSRFAALMPIAKSMADSNEAYYLEHGEYADNAQDLPIQGRMNYQDGTELEFGTSSDYSYVLATRGNDFPNNYIVYQKHSEQYPGEIHCEAAADNTLAQDVCKSFGATEDIGETLTPNYLTYVLFGTGNGVAPTGDSGENDEPDTNTNPEPAVSPLELVAAAQCPQGGDYTCTIKSNGTVSKCNTTLATVDENGKCTANASGGFINPYEYVYDDEGHLTASYTCSTSSMPCYDQTIRNCHPDGSCDAKRRLCTGAAPNTDGTCPNGYIGGDANGNYYNGSPSGNFVDWTENAQGERMAYNACKTVNNTTGNCTEYASMTTFSRPANGTQEYTQYYCKNISGTTCVGGTVKGGTRVAKYDSQGNLTGYSEVGCINGAVQANGSCNTWYEVQRDAAGESIGSSRYCSNSSASGVNWATGTCNGYK